MIKVCDECIHKEVCGYSKELYKIYDRINNLNIDDMFISGNGGFITIKIECNHYLKENSND